MKTGTIDLSNTQTIPAEGFFKPIGSKFSVGLISADLGAASLGFTLKGQVLSGGSVGFATMQENDTDIAETLTSGVAYVKTFEVDDRLDFKLEFTAGTTGTVVYEIIE